MTFKVGDKVVIIKSKDNNCGSNSHICFGCLGKHVIIKRVYFSLNDCSEYKVESCLNTKRCTIRENILKPNLIYEIEALTWKKI